MPRSWLKARPELVEDVRKSLDGPFHNLHLFIVDGVAEVRGSFPVVSADGRVLDRYSVRIRFPDRYPDEMPVVEEVGGRVPRTADRHVFTDSGACCVLLEEARWEAFPVGASFRTFLEGPLQAYFLGQSLVERGEEWPFGEWSHGGLGIAEYYSEVLDTKDLRKIRSFVDLLSLADAKGHHICYCGSGRRLRDCCSEIVATWRARITPATARRSALLLRVPPRTRRSRRTRRRATDPPSGR